MIAFFSVLGRRSRRAALPLLALAAVLAAGCGSSSSGRDGTTATSSGNADQPTYPSVGPEGIPLESGPPLAPASTTTQGTPVDGIRCAPLEQLAYHIHSHLQVYVDGRPRSLPAAIGMVGPVAEQTAYGPFYGATGCYYWLHTHASDGVIHIESPTERIYTLGEFFDEWRQPLSGDRVASATGKVTALVDGRRWTQTPRAIPLLPHTVIQLDVGSPTVPFATISWAGTSL